MSIHSADNDSAFVEFHHFADRPAMSSRVRRIDGVTTRWAATAEHTFELPCIVDHVGLDPAQSRVLWCIEATIDLRQGDPTLVSLLARSTEGFDPVQLQREFRWSSPLEVVTRLVPRLLAAGIDPYTYEVPVSGFPDVTHPAHRHGTRLSDEFLEDIARQYLSLGRGYADELAEKYIVSRRTVIHWIQKARQRGILSRTQPGRAGGDFIPTSRRPH